MLRVFQGRRARAHVRVSHGEAWRADFACVCDRGLAQGDVGATHHARYTHLCCARRTADRSDTTHGVYKMKPMSLRQRDCHDQHETECLDKRRMRQRRRGAAGVSSV